MKRKSILLIMMVLFTSFGLLYAQDVAPDWYLNKPIKEIRFKGLKTVSESDLTEIIDPYIGVAFTDAISWDIQSKLYDLESFEIIIPNAYPGDDDYGSVVIEFEVTERPIIDEIQFKGNSRIRGGELMDTILLKKDDLVNKTKVRLDEAAIKELYLENGFTKVKVKGKIEINEESNTAIVIFNITEGVQIAIKQIQFSGNSFASDNTLKGLLQTKERSIFDNGLFQEDIFEEDLFKIREYYWNRGYIRSEIIETKREIVHSKTEGVDLLVLTIYIREDAQYFYGGLNISGNVIFDEEKLRENVKHKVDRPIDTSLVQRDFQAIQDVYYENGYIFNLFDIKEDVDSENKIVKYSITIVEKSRAHIEKISIRGNEKTKEFVIRRELPFEEGDIFSKTKIIEGLQNLYALQYFASPIGIEPVQGSEEGLMELVIDVEEMQVADITFGLQFGMADFPVSLKMGWQDKNFLGNGQVFGINLDVNHINQSLSFNFMEKWLLGQRWNGGVSFSISHEQKDAYQSLMFPADDNATDINHKMKYDEYDFSLGGSTGYTFVTPSVGRFEVMTGIQSALEYISYDPNLYRPADANLRSNLYSWNFNNQWWFRTAWDTIDNPYMPNNGFRLQEQLTLFGGFLQGAKHYSRSDTNLDVYFKVLDIPVVEGWNFKTVLRFHSGFQYMFDPLGGGTFNAVTGDKPRIDGMITARGWVNKIHTGDSAAVFNAHNYDDGKALWENKFEIRMPIFESIAWFDIFFDAAALWQTDDEIAGIGLEDFKFSIGVGPRLSIPQLPLGIYLVKQFCFDQAGAVHWADGNSLFDWELVFTIGTNF